MRRTEQLQGLRLMKFEDIYGRSCRGELSLVFVPPDRLEAGNGAGRQAWRVRTQRRRQGLGEITRRNALQVEPGQQLLDRPGAPEIGRQDR